MATRKKTATNPTSYMEDKSWRARDDLRTLTTAQEIAKDRSRLAAAKSEAKKQQASLARVHKLSGRKI